MSEFRPRLMIVDDEACNLSILLEMFGRDYRIVAAKNGAQALKRAAKTPPDLILMDVLMPEMDGYTACKRLKENELTRDIPVIFATGLDEAADGYRGLELGGVDYIRKPYDRKIIKARIETHLRLSRKSNLLEELASLDRLTDIPNRPSFDLSLEKEWDAARRSRSPLSLFMVAIDGFGTCAYHHGYAWANESLAKVSGILARSVRRSDIVARYSNEKFAVILPETGRGEGEKIAGLLLDHIREAGIPLEYSPVEGSEVLSISLGIAAGIPGEGLRPCEILEVAERALKGAVVAGGDRYGAADLNP